jgi:multiple sugar transport system substrate-binding protein
VLAAAAPAVLAGCGRARDPRALSLWAMSYEGDYSPTLMPAFTARTGIPVEVQSVPYTSAHEKLLTAHAGDALPDVLMLPNGWVAEFAMIGALAAVPDPRLTADMFPGILDTVRAEGAYRAVPWSVAPPAQFYRRDLMALAGYEAPPLRWREWREAGMRLKRLRPDSFYVLFFLNWPEPLLGLAAQTGARGLRDHDTRGAFSTPEFREALGFYASLFTEGLAPLALATEIQDPVGAFAQGLFAVYPSAASLLLDLKRRIADIPPERWGIVIAAGPHGPGPALAANASLAVSATCRRPAEAWSLVEHMTSAASELRFQQLIGNLPARRSAWDGPQMRVPLLKPFAEQMELPAFPPQIIEWERIKAEMVIVSERIVRGLMSVDEGVAEMDRRADRLLAKRRALLDAGKIA